VRTKTKVGAEEHPLCRSWTPDDTLVGGGIDKVSDDGGSLCIKRTKGCCIESEQKSVYKENGHTREISAGNEFSFGRRLHWINYEI